MRILSDAAEGILMLVIFLLIIGILLLVGLVSAPLVVVYGILLQLFKLVEKT
jgi:hypothetical protein